MRVFSRASFTRRKIDKTTQNSTLNHSPSHSVAMVSTIPRPALLHSDATNGMQHELICIVCHDIPMDVPLITNCSHAFCNTCIRQALRHNSACPVCRNRVSEHELSPISGLLRRVWEQVRVKCPSCEWTGNIGNYQAHHTRSCTTGAVIRSEVNALKRKHEELKEALENERSRHIGILNKLNFELTKSRTEAEEARREVEALTGTVATLKLKLKNARPPLDSTYHYTRENVVTLAQLICRNLENKPSNVDANKIFNCVKHCYDDLTKDWRDNPKHYRIDVQMLLAICRASTWFSNNQSARIQEWCTKQGLF